MKRLLAIIISVFCLTHIHAQYTVRVIVTTIGAKANDDIYIAGNFNDWNPADPDSKLKPFAGGRRIIVFDDVDT
ncbi:MAG: hypothetical protein ABJA35_07420, partial [Parafilimonas sp.]